MSDEIETESALWISGAPPAKRFECTVKTRYRQTDQACEVSVNDRGGCLIRTYHPQRAVTPGQSAVLYQGEACIGGAVIARSWLSRHSSDTARTGSAG
jgi:tRNA-specific 2-thiouridylase